MAEYYTIEAADDGVPIDPGQLRELQDRLRADEDLDLGVRLKDCPPAPGDQGALPVALEIVAAAAPLSTAMAGVLKHWIDKNKISIKVRRKGTDYSVELNGVNFRDAERLLAKLEKETSAEPDNGG
jgi:hypothetical protein